MNSKRYLPRNIHTGLLLTLFLTTGWLVQGQVAQERVMTVQELAQSVRNNNIQLKLASNSVSLADKQIDEVRINRLPDIGINLQASYLGDVTIYDTSWNQLQTVDIPNFGNQFNVGVSQLLSAGGKINKSIQLAELNKIITENQFSDADQTIKLIAAELYVNLYNLQNQKKILEANKVLAEERTKTAQLFLEQDMITTSEFLRVQVLERIIAQNILQVSNGISIANKNLTLLAGIDENTSIIPDIANLTLSSQEGDEYYFRELAFENNPLFKASQTQVSIAQKSLEITKADRLPIIAAFAGYNANRPQAAPALDVFTNTYQVGLSLSYNLETIFKNPKREAVDKVLITQAELAQEAVRQDIEADVNTAYKNYRQAIEQKEVSILNEVAADENYRVTELKYNNQLVTYLEIIDAANVKLQAELQLLNDQTNIILNYIKLLRVTGQL